MNLFAIDFDEIYRRHLCRHAQLGINVLHVLAVGGIYFCLCGIAAGILRLLHVPNVPLGLCVLLVPYFGLLLFNVPLRTWLPTLGAMGVVLAAQIATESVAPWFPWWAYVPIVLLLYRFQQVSHRFYPLSRDMSAFERKYVKGPYLFVLLAVYELPILLHYLLHGRRDWE